MALHLGKESRWPASNISFRTTTAGDLCGYLACRVLCSAVRDLAPLPNVPGRRAACALPRSEVEIGRKLGGGCRVKGRRKLTIPALLAADYAEVVQFSALGDWGFSQRAALDLCSPLP